MHVLHVLHALWHLSTLDHSQDIPFSHTLHLCHYPTQQWRPQIYNQTNRRIKHILKGILWWQQRQDCSTTSTPSPIHVCQRATYLTTVLSPQPALLRWSGNTTYTINALQNHRLVDILNFKWTTNEDIKWGSKSQNNSMNHGWNYWFLYKTKQDNIEHTCQAIQ